MSTSLNVVQIESNRRNALLSTGPRSDAGKNRSSLNALRHGLTARIVVLPTEDLLAYQVFSADFFASLAPETFAEKQCAQTIVDTQWRLNRVRTIEEGMFALGHMGKEGQIDPGHPAIHAALTAAGVYKEHSKAFVNLSIQEQRLYRMLKDATKSLEEMKVKTHHRPASRARYSRRHPQPEQNAGRATTTDAVRVRSYDRRNRHRMPPSASPFGCQNRPGLQLRPQKVPRLGGHATIVASFLDGDAANSRVLSSCTMKTSSVSAPMRPIAAKRTP
jgi:hypothetical protein